MDRDRPGRRTRSYGNFARADAAARRAHDARVAKDREFQWWSEDVAQFRAEQRQEVGLAQRGRAPRRARPVRDAKRKQRQAERKALGLALDPFGDDDRRRRPAGQRAQRRQAEAAREEAAKKRPDPLLRESAAILADALTLLNADRQLSVQVLPAAKTAGHWAE